MINLKKTFSHDIAHLISERVAAYENMKRSGSSQTNLEASLLRNTSKTEMKVTYVRILT